MMKLLADYGWVILFMGLGMLFVFGGYVTSWFIRPSNPSPKKLFTYECGEVPVGSSWVQFNMRYYLFALIFVIFDVEVAFLFPWAVVFKELGLVAFVEMAIFIVILLIGLLYAWRKGVLKWN
ncbi:NADH-quinone oxidoreductase subunit A [Candidatus Desantisbacteria bacterium CG2_30_40_21]|uniref:NADH-quinone oxidoreductase subunit A n=5 Tax=unclassified Candidatus Desantisiibacteriota TaxID=3106372 RepID=A0A2M7J8F6_9BACT|nr:MAG: NADH-quinone oxidoreductase subunit A [Candidatus Desantisbacteria bacterium CG2_30_40_21]PIP40789.1 MAG: NADH-quinone oxidoreductase subunit A [Candidatus Desantisbacteria bacterium CG23_combo_of_CG06-09_8_20_14_all_40_23]PIX15658.1 MAG: NADH-quinone oxidoreductase subunit A [Candidatus Desantisbacteria bacterium CG_4_8_14_3_um_filter_40_12]PIY18961.1 MAG: NADH-quinone oxidoreductase subunit A [Candidatus Desantisbacteria bacterium CG_4_10_14_3_um_filter_40_18]PJB29445.1 MAG: NADH-quin